MEWNQIAVQIILGLALFVGLVFTMLGLPGNLIILLSAVGYGFYQHFAEFNYTFLIVLLAAWSAGELIEFLAGMAGAKREKASRRAMMAAVFGAIVGGIVGTGVLPLIGSILGAMLGSFLASYAAEYSKSGDAAKSQRVAKSVMTGQMLGMIAKFAIGIGMTIAIIMRLL